MKKEEIIQMLSSAESYVSGQELCQHFGVSRTAVWKAMKQLEKEGYQIEAVNNKGYRLLENDDMMSGIEISRYMQTQTFGKHLLYKRETGSTNIDIKTLAEEGAEEGALVVADMQTMGRGRRGRAWTSPSGEAIYMSLLLRPDCEPNKASAITLVMALAAVDAIQEQLGVTCGIKWPNDIVLNKKKLCGILTEMSAEIDAIHYVVVGIGINANQLSFAEEIADKATSLQIELGHRVNRSKLVASVMYHFEQNYHIFKQTYDFSQLKEKYDSFLLNRNQQVQILDPKGNYQGIAEGINEKGELLVRTEDGSLMQVYAGEVSVRGIYSYV